MKARISLLILASIGFCCGAAAATSDNPYLPIVTRNVFALKAPPPPPPPVEPARPALKVTLSGISTMLGKKQALMKAPPAQPKAGDQLKGAQSFVLAEGERQGDVEVISIDAELGKVTIKVGGEVVTIGFEDPLSSNGDSRPVPGQRGIQALPRL
jgi:hypothetical protein